MLQVQALHALASMSNKYLARRAVRAVAQQIGLPTARKALGHVAWDWPGHTSCNHFSSYVCPCSARPAARTHSPPSQAQRHKLAAFA